MPIDLSIVSPCYNEADGLRELVRRVRAAAEPTGLSFEIVLVNDGSTDATWDQMRRLAADPALVCVNLSRNHGHQLALTAGLHVCRGRRILILDADLQDPPELLPQMLEVMDQGADVVFGQRRTRSGETGFKLWTARLFYRLMDALTDVSIPRDTGDFRLISRRALDVLLAMPERHRFIRGMVSWIGFRQVALRYDREARFAGKTKYPLRKMLRFALDGLTAFSTRPLTWASALGFIFAFVSVLLLVYSLVSWIIFSTAPGWASLMAAVTLLGGVQLIVLGIFGEYLGRLYDQSKGRPLFIIESILSAEGREAAAPGTPGAAPPPAVEVRTARPVGSGAAGKQP